jgi:hypothetical protein
VREERPHIYAKIAESLRGLSIAITVDDTLSLQSLDGELREVSVMERATLRVQTSRGALKDLVTGKTTLNRALRAGALDVAGTTSALRAGFVGLELLVHGLLRIDAAEGLREELER